MKPKFINLLDGYKLDHRRQYPLGTTGVYSNFTPRASRIEKQKYVVNFGLQYYLRRYLGELATDTFFNVQRGRVLRDYVGRVSGYLGKDHADAIGCQHISDLHDLGHIPLRFRALPEGTKVPLRIPLFVVENTHPDFFWLTNYIETSLSNILWMPITSATTAHRYRLLLDGYAKDTGGDAGIVPYQAHDFSYRGIVGTEGSALSGAAHLLSFMGTDTLPAIDLLEDYYFGGLNVAASVAATEHAVMCAGGKDDEITTFKRLLELYPTGVVSVVSDTWDLWNVLTVILPQLKENIMAREGKLVIRPDSGVPEDIICGDESAPDGSPARRGVVQLLWDTFGGRVNGAGFRELDPHIGSIYGDSITYERAHEICLRLKKAGYASTNVVLGIGSYTYQYVTRDVYGMAMKATWAQVNNEERLLFKDPMTDNGVKKSARGRIVIKRTLDGGLEMIDGLDKAGEAELESENLLRPVWENGKFLQHQTLAGIRALLLGDNR